jgi:hypothetical protein
MAAEIEARNRSIGSSAGMNQGDKTISRHATKGTINGKATLATRRGNVVKATMYGTRNPARVSMWRDTGLGSAA